MKVISLFAGIGGFDLALTRLDHDIVYVNEWDKYARSIYDRHFTLQADGRDITTVPTSDIPDHDLLVGGFPCQAFSVAGKRQGFADIRGTLFFDVARILKDKRPSYFILENVKGLLSHDKGNTIRVIIATLDELGYDLQWQVLNSKDFGVPQNRERIYIIGHLRGIPRPEVLPLKGTGRKDTGTTEKTPVIYWKNSKEQWVKESRSYIGTLKTHTDLVRRPLILHNVYGGFKEKHLRQFSDYTPTIRTPQGGGHIPTVFENGRLRKMTPVECERAQGFPDGWTEGVSDIQRYKCLGNAVTVNAVTVNVVEAIIALLPTGLEDDDSKEVR